MINWDLIISIIALTSSLIVGVGGYRKSRSESFNIDVDTLAKYQKALREAHDDYSKLCDELERARVYNQALVKQLRENSIVPITIDEALRGSY